MKSAAESFCLDAGQVCRIVLSRITLVRNFLALLVMALVAGRVAAAEKQEAAPACAME